MTIKVHNLLSSESELKVYGQGFIIDSFINLLFPS